MGILRKTLIVAVLVFGCSAAYGLFEFRSPLRNIKASGWTASRIAYITEANEVNSVLNLADWIAGTANEIDVANDGDGTITVGIINPLIVGKGGTGAATFTDHGILLGSGTDPFTALGSATNGQIPIGSTGADPVLAALTGTANEIDVTNGAGTITVGIVNPLIVGKGGTGAATFTDHGILLGSGTDPFTALGAATNGQIPIGSTGADPVLAVLTGTANQVAVTSGAGAITLATPQDIATSSSPQFARMYFDDVNTYIDKDGSKNMTFTDAVSGTQTLADLLSVGSGATLYSFKTITGITNNVVADSNEDTLTLTAAGSLSIVGTTATDTITFTVTETDPCWVAWLAGPPNVSVFTNDSGYLTTYSETDPCFVLLNNDDDVSASELDDVFSANGFLRRTGAATYSTDANTYSLSAHNHTGTYEPAGVAVADITDASANGRSLISAADYAAMRGLLDLEAGTDFYSMSAADTAFEAELNNSAGLLAALNDETGTGVAVFGTSPTFTTSVIMSDGVTIGQATGPLLTFDDTDNILQLTGGVCYVKGSVPSVTTGAVNFCSVNSTAAASGFQAICTGASSSGGGAAIQLISDDGAAMVDGDRLGYFVFAGTSISGTSRNSAGFAGYADGDWVDDSSYPSKIQFETTTASATSRTAKMTIDNAGYVGIGTETPRNLLEISGSTPKIYLNESDQAADEKLWSFDLINSAFYIRTRNDAETVLATPLILTRAGNMTILGTLTVSGNQTGATDHVFDDYDDIELLRKWRRGEVLPFETGDILNRDRLLRDAILQLSKRIEALEAEVKELKSR